MFCTLIKTMVHIKKFYSVSYFIATTIHTCTCMHTIQILSIHMHCVAIQITGQHHYIHHSRAVVSSGTVAIKNKFLIFFCKFTKISFYVFLTASKRIVQRVLSAAKLKNSKNFNTEIFDDSCLSTIKIIGHDFWKMYENGLMIFFNGWVVFTSEKVCCIHLSK